MDSNAFKLFVKFMYLGRIKDSKQPNSISYADTFALLRIANYFHHEFLE